MAVTSIDAAGAAELVEGLAGRGMVIGGDRTATGSAGAHEHHNPTTGTVQATVPLAGADEVDAAVRAARAALPGWRDLPLPERMAVLDRLADLLTARRRERQRSTRSTTGRRSARWTRAATPRSSCATTPAGSTSSRGRSCRCTVATASTTSCPSPTA